MALVHLNYRSKYLCGDTDVHIVLPELPPDVEPKDFYSSGRKYPVLWLLHGSGGDSSAWIRPSNILTYAIRIQWKLCRLGTLRLRLLFLYQPDRGADASDLPLVPRQ